MNQALQNSTTESPGANPGKGRVAQVIGGLLFLLMLLPLSIPAQTDSVQRPKIGLVLSGGGAKGIAHIGALKILDSLQIPVDYIAGTSMGAVIGGLYSVGYSAEQLEKEVAQTDWDELLSQKPARTDVSLFEKEKYDRYILSIDLIDNALSLPGGVNNGHKILNLLNRLTIGYHDSLPFDQLPIPFACTATDLTSGELVVFREGILPLVLRASLSIPSVFAPFEIDDRIFVDGGIFNNLPTNIARNMGADIVIAIDVQTADKKDIESLNVTGILQRVGMIMNLKSTEERLKDCNILIQPDLEGFSLLSFSKSDDLIKAGATAAREQLSQLQKLSSPKTDTNPAPPHPHSFTLNKLVIHGLDQTPRSYIRSIFAPLEGQTTDKQQLDQGIRKIYASGLYDYAYYLLERQGEGHYDLHCYLSESEASGAVNFGIHYDSDLQAVAELGVESKNLLFDGTQFYARFGVSENPRFYAAYNFRPGKWPGIGMELRSHTFRPFFFSEGRKFGRFGYADFEPSIYTFYTLANNAQFRIGASYAAFWYNYRNLGFLEDPQFDPLEPELYTEQNTSLFFSSTFDNLDRSSFPQDGRRLSLEGRIAFPHQKSEVRPPSLVFRLRSRHIRQLAPRWTIEGNLNSAFQIGPGMTYGYSIHAGGIGRNYLSPFERFYGYEFGQLRELSNFHNVKMTLRYRWLRDHHFSAAANYGLSLSLDPRLPNQQYGGYGFSYAYDSRIGPLAITLHRSTERNLWLTYVSLGYWL